MPFGKMAENDIYNSKEIYEAFVRNYKLLALKPSERDNSKASHKYFCQNQANLQYFEKLFLYFESKDLSYVRRIRLLGDFKIICHAESKDLKDCDRDDIDGIIRFMHTVRHSSHSKKDFIQDVKHLWKILFPERDSKGRIDDTIMPYPVRHLSSKIDKSREKRRDDRLTAEEFEALVQAFSGDVRLQAYITLEFESLGRPQEILYTKIKDAEIYDNYIKIWISEHGKEGTGFLQCIDSYPYVAKWLNQHPLRSNPEAFIFINLGDKGMYGQLRPENINKHIKEKLAVLGIKKKITCYSLKRNGVTFRRLRGDSDATIQHVARWTTTKQLKTYDYSHQDDVFKIELAKRGLIKDKALKRFEPMSKTCLFCNTVNGLTDQFCSSCKRPLDRKKIVEEQENAQANLESERREREAMRRQMEEMQGKFDVINSLMNELGKDPEVLELLAKKAREKSMDA